MAFLSTRTHTILIALTCQNGTLDFLKFFWNRIVQGIFIKLSGFQWITTNQLVQQIQFFGSTMIVDSGNEFWVTIDTLISKIFPTKWSSRLLWSMQQTWRARLVIIKLSNIATVLWQWKRELEYESKKHCWDSINNSSDPKLSWFLYPYSHLHCVPIFWVFLGAPVPALAPKKL